LRSPRWQRRSEDRPGEICAAALEVFASADFVEGIRAAIIDKDRNPKWSPARIEDVTPEIVARYLAPLGKDDLVFPTQET